MGVALGWMAGSVLPWDWVAVVAAIVAGANGAVSGWVGLYGWHEGKGWLFFVLDSTWGLFGTALGVVLHLVNVVRGSYVGDMSRRTNRHVYEAGIGLRKEFALALGNVISNAGGKVGLRGETQRVSNRRRFVVRHEGLHVLQNRLFGPIYQLVYVAWMVVFAVVGIVIWLVRERRHLGSIVETLAYYNNPFEYWAYRNDRYWPPKGVHPRYAWGGPKALT